MKTKKIRIKKDMTFSNVGLTEDEKLALWRARKELNGLPEWDYLMAVYDEVDNEIFFTTNSFKFSKFENLTPIFNN